jgi:outer membrane immunogenic protein
VFSWTGFYVGVNGGFGVGNRTFTCNGNDAVTRDIACVGSPLLGPGTCPSPISDNHSGWIGGLQAGYNWQLNPHFVVGIETNFDSSGIRGDGTSRFQDPILTVSGSTFLEKLRTFRRARS